MEREAHSEGPQHIRPEAFLHGLVVVDSVAHPAEHYAAILPPVRVLEAEAWAHGDLPTVIQDRRGDNQVLGTPPPQRHRSLR